MSGELRYWPLLMGWTLVVVLALFGWKRQAVIAAAGMTLVSLAVIRAGMGGA